MKARILMLGLLGLLLALPACQTPDNTPSPPVEPQVTPVPWPPAMPSPSPKPTIIKP
ncbi:MAG: hypothetical protein ACAI44_09125 [Candidatus Sericytochromatia bacterium]